MPAAERAAERFAALTGTAPDGVWTAPGRVNLIGEHTDYNGGLALPFAVDRVTAVAARRTAGTTLRLWSAQEPAAPQVAAPFDRPSPPDWARYPIGVARALTEAGVGVGGADLVVDSDVPVGAGLSSSAALLLAVAGAMAALAAADLGPSALAEVCHRAETVHAGVPVGYLDHLAIAHARPGHALLIDFSTAERTPVPLAVGPLVVVDTGVRHDHGSGAYRRRREECEAAARALGVGSLRQAAAADLARLGGVEGRRARHVHTENARVTETVRRLHAGEAIGPLLTASHRSLREDFEVSCPELDLVVDVALAAGAEGARLTGGGFGGSAIVVGLPAGELAGALDRPFRAAGLRAPTVAAVTPAGGPRRA